MVSCDYDCVWGLIRLGCSGDICAKVCVMRTKDLGEEYSRQTKQPVQCQE